MYTPDDIIYTTRQDSYEEESRVDYYTLYGSIMAATWEPAIVSHAWYSTRAHVRKATLHILSALSGTKDERIDRSLKMSEDRLYDDALRLLWDPKEYKWIGLLTLERVIDIITPAADELIIPVSKNAETALMAYYHRAGNELIARGKIHSAWDMLPWNEPRLATVVYTLWR